MTRRLVYETNERGVRVVEYVPLGSKDKLQGTPQEMTGVVFLEWEEVMAIARMHPSNPVIVRVGGNVAR